MDGSLLAIVLAAIAVFTFRSAKARRRSSSRRRNGAGERAEPGDVVVEISTAFRFSQGRRMQPAESAKAGDTAWLPPGRSATVAGYEIADGMIYVGGGLEPVCGSDAAEPALIDSSLAVDRRSPDRTCDLMGYWPSYSQIEPASRAAYLEWLSTGRRKPNFGIGHVFLFFYGLERRLLFDLPHLPERRAEVEILMVEIERLLGLYGRSKSFKHYAIDLLHTAQALWGAQRIYREAPVFGPGLDASHLNVRLALAQLVADREPIPALWAFTWLLSDPETKLRTPAQRCPKLFQSLFAIRYEQAFGAGMELEPNRTAFELKYSPASRPATRICLPSPALPEVMSMARPRKQLGELANAVMSELDPYSRFIGRNPAAAESLEALSRLPVELTSGDGSRAIEDVTTWLDFTLGLEPVADISARELMQHWRCARDDRMSKSELEAFASMLDGLGFGVEPDPRFGGGGIKPEQGVVLFELTGEPVKSASQAYQAASLVLHLTTLVAISDGQVHDAERRQLETHLEGFIQFGEAERQRLRMHVRWLLAEPLRLSGMKKQLQKVDAKQRQKLGEYAAAMATADGVIKASEIKTVEKIYGLLGLKPEQAHRALHELRATQKEPQPAQEPVVVRPGSKAAVGFSIPAAPAVVPASGVQLDVSRIQRILADTEAVASVLSEIFEEGEDGGPPDATPTSVIEDPIAAASGLGAAHGRLLRALANHGELSRAGFEQLAAGEGLLPDGAYEVLNELAFESVDAPLLEGSDPIEVNLGVLKEIIQ